MGLSHRHVCCLGDSHTSTFPISGATCFSPLRIFLFCIHMTISFFSKSQEQQVGICKRHDFSTSTWRVKRSIPRPLAKSDTMLFYKALGLSYGLFCSSQTGTLAAEGTTQHSRELNVVYQRKRVHFPPHPSECSTVNPLIPYFSSHT